MTAAEDAFEVTKLWIENTIKGEVDRLELDKPETRALTTLPPSIAKATSLRKLYLNNTRITDIAPLQSLSGLQGLTLENTQIADITPLQSLSGMKTLYLDNTKITDLRPIAHLASLIQGPMGGSFGLTFQNTPATQTDETLRTLSEIKDKAERTEKTLTYLRSLPEWPEPYTPEGSNTLIGGSPNIPPKLSVEALIEAQELAGWRFSPTHGALELYVSPSPSEQQQLTLAELVKQRVADLMERLKANSNSGGIRQSTAEELARFAQTLNDETRSLNDRSLELWVGLVALGTQLDANDKAAAQGRHELDRLTVEARASLIALLGVSSGFVRSFPEARAMDDEHRAFNREAVSIDAVNAIYAIAFETAIISKNSAELIERLADLAANTGTQAGKAESTTISGARNLTWVAAMIGGAVGGIAGGALDDIGGDISDHYELSERAIAFIDKGGVQLEELINALPVDDQAQLRAAIKDAQNARRDRR